MNNEEKAREYLKSLKEFYTNLMIYGIILAVCVITWMFSGGSFWPIWVFLGLGISSLMQGIKLGIFPMLKDVFPFLSPDWEEKRLKAYMDEETPPTHDSSSRKHSTFRNDPTDDQGA